MACNRDIFIITLSHFRRYIEHCLWSINGNDDNDKPIKSLLKGKGLLPPVGLARLDS
jgi:hypothetical protein